MIYIPTPLGRAMLILDQITLDRIRSGKWIITPDQKFVVTFTPDAPWVEAKLNEHFLNGDINDVAKLQTILDESQLRRPHARPAGEQAVEGGPAVLGEERGGVQRAGGERAGPEHRGKE